MNMAAAASILDPFEALGVPRDASTAAIKARWRDLCLRYHPNRHQGPDESKHGLTEHFLNVQQAWKILSQPENRRRYVELLDLLDTQNAILAGMADLLEEAERNEHRIGSNDDGNISSDADEDALPTITRRKTALERSMSTAKHGDHLGDAAETSECTSPRGRIGSLLKRLRGRDSGFHMPILRTGAAKEEDYFALRRKKLEKLQRREGKAFFAYRDAMLHKFEAELEVERYREEYETARWKRDYFERAPRETAERFKSFQRYMAAVQAFNNPRSTSRRRSTASHAAQILSTDETLQSQHLIPGNIVSPTRRKTLHRRGWSSDVTGDQTSSDDNSSDDRPSRASTSSWLWHRLQGHQHSLNAIAQLPDRILPKQLSRGSVSPPGSDVPDQGPFKLLVKRPTGFTEGLEVGKDSSPDSSSRSPSPSPERAGGGSLHKFSLMQASRIAEFLGASHYRSWLLGLHSTNEGGQSKPRSLHDDTLKQFEIKHVGRPQFHDIPVGNVHLLSHADKRAFLNTQLDVDTSPGEILARLRQLDGRVAERFVIKPPDIMEKFHFRLIYGHGEVPRHDHGSFIALSYRRKRHVKETGNKYSLPLEPEMFQALLEERLSASEGLWVDQICIDQQSEREKVVSMSAMDLVYRSARVAVVVLDDIELEAYQGEILRCHMDEYDALQHVPPQKRFRNKQPSYLQVKEDLYLVIQILLQSSWFKRAWCRHEMRLARKHIFLVPVKSPGTWRMNVVRFTGHCLSHLLGLATEVPFEPSVETVKPALQAFFRDRSQLGADETLVSHGNWTTVTAEVWAMEAGGDPRIPVAQRAFDAFKDKISIILNTMECGLALAPMMRKRNVSLSKAECHYMLLMLALAARDPGALTSVGPPMRLVQADAVTPTASNTWLFEPTNVDSGLNNYRTRHRFSSLASIETAIVDGEHFVKLDLKMLQPTQRDGHNPSKSGDHAAMLVLAKRISAACFERKLGRNRHRYLISDGAANRHFGDMRAVYERTLACVLECGPDWLENICHRYGVSRWRSDLRPAYELLIALKNTVGRWPESAWTSQAVGFLMDFVNFLVIRGMPQRQILHHEEWRPIAVELDNGGRVLTFVPPGSIQAAVPTALLDTDYVQLARLWVLQHRETHEENNVNDENNSNDSWTLLGKSVLFSDDLAIERLHSTGGIRRERQRVFGRDDTHRNVVEKKTIIT